jgi:hypothetical protein
MSAAFDREALLEAFDTISRAAVGAGTKLQIAVYIAVYEGSALMLASNFRFATEDVDVSKLEPTWLQDVIAEIAGRHGWDSDWFNDQVAFHLSPLADRAADHLEFGTFPRDGTPPGLEVSVPSAEYPLAPKLKAFRITDPIRGEMERLDILNLMKIVGISTADEAIALLARYFPVSAASREGGADAPKYPR